MKSLTAYLQNSKHAVFESEALHQPEPQKMSVNSGSNTFPMISSSIDGL